LPDLIFFFGAGASKAFANIPTMKDMVADFEKEIEDDNELKGLYQRICQIIGKRYPGRLDLEAVFSVLNGIASDRKLGDYGFHAAYEASRRSVDPTPRPPTEQAVAKKLIERYEEFIIKSCEIDEKNIYHMLRLYSRLLEKAPGTRNQGQATKYSKDPIWWSQTWAFYTTNYDTCIERICMEAGITIENGFQYDPGKRRSFFSPRNLIMSTLGGNAFKIVKLHGSVSWYRLKDGSLIDFPEGVPPKGTVEGRVMLYPIEEKKMYEEPHIILLNAFREDLKGTPKWLFIGYRFNDPFLMRIIEYCSDPSKKMAIVHPNAEEIIKTRLTDVRGQITPISRRFSDEATVIGEIGSWMMS
jgi:hypothetical protein